ncbi:MAG: hypothetical protein FWD13_09140 [Treponema sp.]|nr:hypothetical protein [Treponema sp.]
MRFITQIITANESKSKKEAEKIILLFKPIKNLLDGRIAEIPRNTIGKIYGHKGYDITRIIEHIPILYETALFGWTEPETKREGHKLHPNINKYHHYINKFTDGNKEYYIRFTLTEEKAKPGKTGKSKIHSTAISDIALYKNGGSSNRIRVIYPGEISTPPFYDIRLAEFLNTVKNLN